MIEWRSWELTASQKTGPTRRRLRMQLIRDVACRRLLCGLCLAPEVGVDEIWAERACKHPGGPTMEEHKTCRVFRPHERLCCQIQNHPFHLYQDLEGFAMAVEEHTACRRRSDPLGDDLASVESIHLICLDLLDRRAAASTCSTRTRNLSSPCNPAGRLGLFPSPVPHQSGSGGVGLYFQERNCQKLLQKDFQRAFLAPPRISAASLHDS